MRLTVDLASTAGTVNALPVRAAPVRGPGCQAQRPCAATCRRAVTCKAVLETTTAVSSPSAPAREDLSPAAPTQQPGDLRQDAGSSSSSSSAEEAGPSCLLPEQLFADRHVARWTPGLVLYFPLGCLLAVLRMAFWVAMLAVDTPWLTDNDAMIDFLQRRVLGVRVTWRNAARIPGGRHVLVSNHVSVGDLMVLYRRPRKLVHLISAKLPARVSQARHHRVRLLHAVPQVYEDLARPHHQEPVHLFPEGGMTNGRGMLRFSRGFLRFGADLPIVPVALRMRAPFDVATHTLTSSFAANLFWFCFLPSIELEATVLPPQRMQPGEKKAEFAQRVQRIIAAELGIAISDLTLQGKRALMAQRQAPAGGARGKST